MKVGSENFGVSYRNLVVGPLDLARAEGTVDHAIQEIVSCSASGLISLETSRLGSAIPDILQKIEIGLNFGSKFNLIKLSQYPLSELNVLLLN